MKMDYYHGQHKNIKELGVEKPVVYDDIDGLDYEAIK